MPDTNVAQVNSAQRKSEEGLSIDNLIVLYIDRGVPDIVPLRQVEKEFEINLEEGTWAYRGKDSDRLPQWAVEWSNGFRGRRQSRKFRMGEERPFVHQDLDGIVGVYDRTNDDNLKAMLYHWEHLKDYLPSNPYSYD